MDIKFDTALARTMIFASGFPVCGVRVCLLTNFFESFLVDYYYFSGDYLLHFVSFVCGVLFLAF